MTTSEPPLGDENNPDPATSGTSLPPVPSPGGGAMPPPPPPPPMGGPAPAGSNRNAVWSMVLGIVGIVCCGLFAGIPAIILGKRAQTEIAATGQLGDGQAKAGIILGWITVALSLVGVALWIFVVATRGTIGFFSTNY